MEQGKKLRNYDFYHMLTGLVPKMESGVKALNPWQQLGWQVQW